VFALVYIDDIVVYSQSFEEHLKHLGQVFKAISDAHITLAPGKCYFAYESLLLLGQKVSRLGLSTHKKKVNAILHLAEPKNVQELQSFLGMMVYFSAYIPFYSWIAHPLFQLLRKNNKWHWDVQHTEAFELCKQVLTNAPVRAYAIPGSPYRLYTDACDYGIAAILQQVQPIQIKDLKGTKTYDRLWKTYQCGEPIPSLVTSVAKTEDDVPNPGNWAEEFEDTTVFVERVISYWSRILKSAERNYSPTEREALALKEGLIKFQPFIEGESVIAITDHAALTWTKTYQNVNRRLLSWGAVLAGYPKLRIVHRAGRVHSNVDPLSRLRRRVPYQEGPLEDTTDSLKLKHSAVELEDPLKNMYEELGSKFEEKMLKLVHHTTDTKITPPNNSTSTEEIQAKLPNGEDYSLDYTTSNAYSIMIGIEPGELERWRKGYWKDTHFKKILAALQDEENYSSVDTSLYQLNEEGLLYFKDWNGNYRLCVPQELRLELTKECHDTLTEAAHAGHHKTYNRMSSTYYWPKMSRQIKAYTDTCDICQKSKPRRHAPAGLLQPIPIPTQPFEVVTMDFIPELPESNGYDNILVIVDKLTKYALFIPTTTRLTEVGAAQLFFDNVITHYGIPHQVITDRDTRWKGDFWGEICRLLGTKRALTTAYHPQADGQTEIMNQGLEISLRAYVGPSRDDWSQFLNGLALAYNSTPHTATGFAPAFLLRGYVPLTSSTMVHHPEAIPRPGEDTVQTGGDTTLHQAAEELVERFEEERDMAKEALLLAQMHMKKAYNHGHLNVEFEEGDLVVLNPHTLNLLKKEKGKGQKLLMKYDGPFEVLQKLNPVTYRLRMPASYGMHPVINIAHLEKYNKSPMEFGDRPSKSLNREDFEDLSEYEVEDITGEKYIKKGNRKIKYYKTRFRGYGPEWDEWLTAGKLKNAPEVLERWKRRYPISK
jgi:hypothetical protein